MHDAAARLKHVPGEPGVWVIIFGDLLVFALFFGTFAFYRCQEPTVFAASHLLLGEGFGLLNTVWLLTSSWLVALGLAAARAGGKPRRAGMLVLLAMGCGAAFVVTKIFEYHSKVAAGLGPTTNDFFMLYFTLTGIHLLHVVVGLAALTLLYRRCAQPTPRPTDAAVMESCAVFWHMVDMLWVVLFALFYLHA